MTLQSAGRALLTKRALVLDVLTVLCCALVLIRLSDQKHTPNGNHDASKWIGRRISWLPEPRQRSTYVLIAISPGCPFCSQSAPFYRRLTSVAAQRGNVRVIAIMPPNRDSDAAYVAAENLPFTEFHYDSLNRAGVAGTPTLFVVDASGIVLHSWEGRLNGDAERAAMAEVFG